MATEEMMYRKANHYKRHNFDEKRTHKSMALEYIMLNGSITPLEALTAFGCFRLASVICELRKEGFNIDTAINEEGKHFAIYTLRGEEN